MDCGTRQGSQVVGVARLETTAPSAVQGAQSTLDENIGMLHEALNRLTDRLQPVLSPEPPQPNAKEGVRPVASTVSQRIHESSASVNYAISRVRLLLDRLEV